MISRFESEEGNRVEGNNFMHYEECIIVIAQNHSGQNDSESDSAKPLIL